MMNTCRIELGISPLSNHEAEQALDAFRQAWRQPACVGRRPCGDAWLLSIRHEADLRVGESPAWFAERIAAAMWHAVGRYARITLEVVPQDEKCHQLFVFDEDDYRRILRDFRLSKVGR